MYSSGMDDINDYMFVFYWRGDSKDSWSVSQPVSLGEIMDGGVEFDFHDGGSLPVSDINWATDEVKISQVPPRKYVHTIKEK
jgi:hypothetical protein